MTNTMSELSDTSGLPCSGNAASVVSRGHCRHCSWHYLSPRTRRVTAVSVCRVRDTAQRGRNTVCRLRSANASLLKTFERLNPNVMDQLPQGAAVETAESSIAAELVNRPEVWQRLLATHVPGHLDRCRGCRSSGRAGERWPCKLFRIAQEALRLYHLRARRIAGG